MPAPGAPICPASEIFDEPRVTAALDAALAAIDPADHRARRAEAVRLLGAARDGGNDALAAAFARHPHHARGLITGQAWLTDGLVRAALHVAQTHLHPRPNPTEGERIALLAVGGYGRAEMAPHSDIDLLFLIPWKLTGWAESLVESMLYILWDLKLKVGHATRTVAECLRLGRDDITIRTALLEHRFLAGDDALAAELKEKLWTELFRSTGAEFIEAKLAERTERHRRQGGQRYMLEPNVKEGKGGLRDLQTLYWIAKYLHRVGRAAELVDLGVFRPEEYAAFAHAETFLWAVRCHLHYITGRAMDQLTFDLQVEVAGRMGYEDGGGRRAVEIFMQAYFRQATKVGELTRIFLTALEARHVKTAPMLAGLFRRRRRRKLREGMVIVQNRLDVRRREGVPGRQAQHPAAVRGGAAHRPPAPSRRDAPGRRQSRPDRRRDARGPRSQPHLPRPACSSTATPNARCAG